MKLGRYNVPTPLLVGGIAGVGVLVLGQRLTGDAAPAAPAPTGQPGDVPATGAGVGDAWGDSEVGQFPSFPSAGGGGGAAVPDWGWWDPEAPPPPAGPINVPSDPTPTPTTPTTPTSTWYPGQLGTPPAGTTGYIAVDGSTYWYRTSGSRIIDRTLSGAAKFAAFVSGPSTYTWPGHASVPIVRILSGAHKGKLTSTIHASVRLVRKP